MKNLDNPKNNKDVRSVIDSALKTKDDVEISEALFDLAQTVKDDLKREIISANVKKVGDEENVEIRMLKNVILPGEKLRFTNDRAKSRRNLEFGKLVRGLSGQGWKDAENERNYYINSESNSNILMPNDIANEIIDLARNQSAILGKIPITPMAHNNLKVLTQKKDAEGHFVTEGDLIPSSEAVFDGVDMKGKTLAMFIPISLQLLESADNLDSQLELTTAKAIAQALDKALLYGKGIVKGKADEIKGITLYDNINKLTHNNVDYDLIIKGAKPIKKANIIPTNVCYNTDLASDLEMQKDSTGQYITMPNSLLQYVHSESNNLKDNTAIVYDKNSLLLGINQELKMEWGTSQDMFQRLQVGLRLYIRADLAIVNPKGISIVEVSSVK